MECEGSCKKHEGEVKTYHVTDPSISKDWGNFNYCEVAVKEDNYRGLKVELAQLDDKEK